MNERKGNNSGNREYTARSLRAEYSFRGASAPRGALKISPPPRDGISSARGTFFRRFIPFNVGRQRACHAPRGSSEQSEPPCLRVAVALLQRNAAHTSLPRIDAIFPLSPRRDATAAMRQIFIPPLLNSARRRAAALPRFFHDLERACVRMRACIFAALH